MKVCGLLLVLLTEKLLLAAFHNKVTLDLFIHKLYDWEPQTMAELIHLA